MAAGGAGAAGTGHRSVPHTADLRVEAWAPTREACIAEAVTGAVESFADTSAAVVARIRRFRVRALSDPDLLVGVLDEVVYLLDTAAEVPVSVRVRPAGADLEVELGTAEVSGLEQTGAVPKAVSLHELELAAGPAGWRCSVTLDV